jgi:mannosyltransferase OCH1-like enzyme
MIPKNIFQTHKFMLYIQTKPKLLDAVNSWRQHRENFNYNFYTDEMCEEFIQENFESDVYNAYMRLPMAVMKADLWRYCIIYKHGGIYADTDTVCKVDPSIFLKDTVQLVLVPENSTHLCQWVFAAPKESPILKSVIDLSVQRILNIPEIKGEHIIHHLTGPGVFTDGIERYLREQGLPTFPSNRNMYVNYPITTLHVFEPSTFHGPIVQHLFTGQDPDGWCQERAKKLI